MNKSKQKQKLRKTLLKRRNSLSEKEYFQKSRAICRRLTDLSEYKKAKSVHCYVSINERNEVNTHPLIKKMLAEGKRVIVPISEIEKGTLRNVQLNQFKDLKPNRWGVLEPAEGEEAAHHELDLIIVPMAGGDMNKNRIGYGKGFYDRFLAQTNCLKIGLLFEPCLEDEIPTESFDVKLDKLITEQRLL
ncbi:MAG TPA: 5-formyltetrahydrofolate cyclo-ligase [Balneolaceae bacterium]|nr:5-formyltetrahydrofolate cyclo-ligase [Balneolaceae bacterium]